jgi:hypothetical protein
MPFGLEFLEEFIQTEIRLKQQKQSPLNESDARDKLILLESEIEKTKRQLRDFMFQSSSENQMENSIQLFQANLITLADIVMKCRDSIVDEWDSYERILCVSIYAHIDELLKYTERYFSKYFNQDEFVPVAYVWMARNEISNRLDEIEPLIVNVNVDDALLKIALYPVRDFVDQRDKSFTYRRIIFIRQLIADLKDKLGKR